MKTVKTLNVAGLQILLARVNGAKPLTISAFVDARCRKTGNPFKEVRKLSKVNGMTGANFEASVNRQQVREGATEGTFQAGERKWGERVSSALVEKEGKWYLAIQPRSTAKPLYFAKKADGEPFVNVAKSVVEPFLPVVKPQAESQGVEKEVIYRNYSLENIASITMDGETYRVRH